jgi:hypothetical protein
MKNILPVDYIRVKLDSTPGEKSRFKVPQERTDEENLWTCRERTAGWKMLYNITTTSPSLQLILVAFSHQRKRDGWIT